MLRKILYTTLLLFLFNLTAYAQWTPDLGNGMYKNPVIFADYSDPDVIRVEDDFYMVASSFNAMPGIPVLHSKDLVNWEIIGHVYDRLPIEKYNEPQHGEGSWAPSIRYHDGKFYVYFCTPEEGLFVGITEDPAGDWDLHHVVDVERWEDPSPLWDDNGNAYLVRSKLRGDILYIHKMSPDGKEILDNGQLVFQDTVNQDIIEGPKFMKKNGYYYILAPAGGVPTGWQTVLRSKDVYGPYEDKIVLHQGNTDINGPHQGGLIDLESGESWFLHFQDRGFYGRIVHMQPVHWEDGWPLMGQDINDDGIGEPVPKWEKPDVGKTYPIQNPQTTDEFDSNELGLQWQWHANPKEEWYSFTANEGSIRLNAVQNLTQDGNLWFVPNLLLQKFPAPSFTATTKITANPKLVNERSGLVVMGRKWAYLAFNKLEDGLELGMYKGTFDKHIDVTKQIEAVPAESNTAYLRVDVDTTGACSFSYSFDGEKYQSIGEDFQARPGVWIGAKVGLFNVNPNMKQSDGYMDAEWFRVK